MGDVLHWLQEADADVARAVASLRWAPLTTVMELLSSRWVKGPLLVALALAADVVRVRRGAGGPLALPAVLVAILLAWLVGDELLKPLVDRGRPPRDGHGLRAIVRLPDDPSFPSGHATQAFAAATCLAVLVPPLRPWPVVLAALIALSRVYLGVHFPSDVLAGALLGTAIGLGVAALARRAVAGGAQARRASTARGSPSSS